MMKGKYSACLVPGENPAPAFNYPPQRLAYTTSTLTFAHQLSYIPISLKRCVKKKLKESNRATFQNVAPED